MEEQRKSMEGGPTFPFEVPMTPLLASHDTSGIPTSPDRTSARGESLSPASSSSSSIPELAGRASSSNTTSHAARDVDAKSSALKALAGISKVVSRSRQVDAEALQAIKAQRAKVKAGVGPSSAHPHSRTMSTESVPSPSEHSGSSLPLSTSSGGGGGGSGSVSSSAMHQQAAAARGTHRRSHSGMSPTAGYGSPVAASPQSYSDILSCMSLGDLLALQSAVETEIQNQLTNAGLIGCASTSSQSPPQSAAEAIMSAQYAAAVFATQQQQHQHLTSSAIAMQQTLAGVGPGGMDHMQMGGSNSGSTTGSRAHSPLGSSPRKGSRAGSCHSRSHSTDTVLRHCSPGIDPVLGAAAMLGPSANANLSLGLEGFNMNLAGLGGDGMPQAPPTARSLDVGAPQPPQPPATGYNSSDFSFLSDFQPKLDLAQGGSHHLHHHHLGGSPHHLGVSGHLLAPQSVPVNSPFMHSTGAMSHHAMHSMMGEHHRQQQQQQQQRSPSPPPSPPQQQHDPDFQLQQQQQQLSSLFANLQLGDLDPWQ